MQPYKHLLDKIVIYHLVSSLYSGNTDKQIEVLEEIIENIKELQEEIGLEYTKK